MLFARAPAKINLTLHIRRRRPDGFHDLESLVAFTGFGDILTLNTAQPGGLTLSGPRAEAIGPAAGNLVLGAMQNLQTQMPHMTGGAFHLVKNLPAAAGIGGGSSDAAAALRLLAAANHLQADDPGVMMAAGMTGSDVSVCIARRARMMTGRGDTLGPLIALPPLYAVLVNPGVALQTKDVFAQLRLKPGEESGYGAHPEIASGLSLENLIERLKRSRNDMEDAASMLAPVIGDVLAVIGAARGCKLARMSGSGATCFGLFQTRHAASRAARVIGRDHADWWVKACVLR